MAEEKTEDNDDSKPAGAKKKLLMVAGLAALLLLGGGGAGTAWLLGHFSSGHAEDPVLTEDGEPAAPPKARSGEVVFVDMPDVLVNLHSLGQRTRFLKLRVALEVESEPLATRVKGLMPRVMDSFQGYLRALTVDEVSGPGGMQRLKEELTARVNLALEPTRVEDVLIKEMLVQ